MTFVEGVFFRAAVAVFQVESGGHQLSCFVCFSRFSILLLYWSFLCVSFSESRLNIKWIHIQAAHSVIDNDNDINLIDSYLGPVKVPRF